MKHRAVLLWLITCALLLMLMSAAVHANPSKIVKHPSRFARLTRKRGVFTHRECEMIIRTAEGGTWLTKRHANYPTIDQEIESHPQLVDFVYSRLRERVLPRMGDLFGSDHLVVYDCFIAKYHPEQMASLAPHRDGSLLSFVVSLNDDFDGGGTHFFSSNTTIKCQTGEAVAFCGKLLHGSKPVTKGTRYILTGFVEIVDASPRLRQILQNFSSMPSTLEHDRPFLDATLHL